MKEFRVTLTHRAGELARMTQLIADHGVNLKSLAGVADSSKAVVCLISEDVVALRSALEAGRIPFEESELFSELLENEPGQIADLAARLENAGVNLHSLYILGRDETLIEVGFTVDDPKKAKHALG
jgi:hypothetical protein